MMMMMMMIMLTKKKIMMTMTIRWQHFHIMLEWIVFESLRNTSECQYERWKEMTSDVCNSEHNYSHFVYEMKYSKHYFIISKIFHRAGNYISIVSNCILQTIVSNANWIIGYPLWGVRRYSLASHARVAKTEHLIFPTSTICMLFSWSNAGFTE